MNILVTGTGRSGSWKIRGEQLGAAIGATVLPNAVDVSQFDLVVAVKRVDLQLAEHARAAGVPLVWDVVDAYPQPGGNDWTEFEAKQWLEERMRQVRPSAIVAATEAMARDCKQFGVPTLALPHHARAGGSINPVRPRMRCVGYEGGLQYIRRWSVVMAEECRSRGLIWNPSQDSLDELDVVVAVRDQTGYPVRAWKSNVKLANAQATGTPVICAREAGYLETDCGGVLYADTRGEMRDALDAVLSHDARLAASIALLKSAIFINPLAARYRSWLENLR